MPSICTAEPSYARTKDGQIEIHSVYGWCQVSRLAALADIEVLKATKDPFHNDRIRELQAALGIT